MKKLLLLISLSLFSTISFSQINLDSGLIAYYPLDENTKDYSGNFNDGTGKYLVQIPSRNDELNGAIRFHQFSVYPPNWQEYSNISVPHNNALNLGSAFTINMWVRYPYGYLHIDEDPLLSKGMEGNGFILHADQQSIRLRHKTYNYIHGSRTTEPGFFADSKWHMITITLGNGVGKVYYDDTLVGTQTINWAFDMFSQADLIIGQDSSKRYGQSEVKDLDDIRIYNRALSEEEVMELYDAGINKSVAYNQVKGVLFKDDNGNCVKDVGEPVIPYQMVYAEPGPFYSMSDKDGNYTLMLPKGKYRVTSSLGGGYKDRSILKCPQNKFYQVTLDSNTIVTNQDFGFQIDDCNQLGVDLEFGRARRCVEGYAYVSYSNQSFEQVDNVKIEVSLPPEFILKSVTHNYSLVNGKLVFDMGSLAAQQKGRIAIKFEVKCGDESLRGKTVCGTAKISPNTPCTRVVSSQWDGSDMKIAGQCIDDSMVMFSITNYGDNMEDSLGFKLYTDSTIALKYNYKLNKSATLPIELKSRNYTYRIVAEQHEDYPGEKFITTVVDGCPDEGIARTSYINNLPNNEKRDSAIECAEITDSYDPNEKQIVPKGVGANNQVVPGVPLHYTIHFQNTGNDTAYKVVLVDTLSKALDLTTIRIGASSYDFEYSINDNVLTFTFNDIYLVDSNTNETGSKGFVKFAINPIDDVILGTQINNNADIYFDFNSPVRTNTTMVTIDIFHPKGKGFLGEVKVGDKILSVTDESTEVSNIELKLYPNPASDIVNISFANLNSGDLQVDVISIDGKSVYTSSVSVNSQSHVIQVDVSSLAKGVYYVTVLNGDVKKILKMVVQ